MGQALWVPTLLPNLEWWLKADTLGLANLASVNSWPDSSGNGRTATPFVGQAAPVYKTGVSITGLPMVEFNGVNNNMHAAFPAGGLTNSTVTHGMSIYFYVNWFGNAAPHNGGQVIWQDESGSSPQLIYDLTGFPNFGAIRTAGTGTLGTSQNNVAGSQTDTWIFRTPDSAVVPNFIPAPGDQASYCSQYVNGVCNYSSWTWGVNNFAIGCYLAANQVQNVQFFGRIGEVLFYSNEHTAAQRQLVEGYLRRKWG
jgi:hypothetical protein